MPHDSISALVVDDEPPARRRLVEFLKTDSHITSVFEAENGIEAVAQIESHTPDIVFLDIQMPGVDGFGVVEALGVDRMPLTVFVTAYDKFALKAFDANAVDYLLKPYSDERCQVTLKRALTRLEQSRLNGASGDLRSGVVEELARQANPDGYLKWLVIKNSAHTTFVIAEDIEWIEAAGVYVNLHVGGKELLYRAGLQALCDRLDPCRFVRIHRSYAVNMFSIAQLEKRSHGEFDVLLKCGARLTLSRTYRANVERLLGQSL